MPALSSVSRIWNNHTHTRGKMAITDWWKLRELCKWGMAVCFVELLPLEALMELHSSEEAKKREHENEAL